MALVFEDDYVVYQRLPNVDEAFALTFPDAGPIHEALWWSTQTTHAPAQYHLGPCLAVICHELAWRGWRVDHHERMVPQVWAALVGSPSSGKSTALRLYRELYRDVLARVEGARGPGGANGPLQRPDPFVDTEGTPQGLLEHLARFRYSPERDETHGILFEEEFSQLLEADRKITEYLIKLADGETIRRKLRQMQAAAAKGEKVYDSIVNPRLSGAFSATESSMRRVLRPDHIEGGFFSRVFWLTATLQKDARLPFHTSRPTQRAQTVVRWSNWLASLDGLETIQKQREQFGEIADAKLVEIPDAVKNFYVAEWFEKIERNAADYDLLEATVTRLGRTIRMLSGVYALSRACAVVDDADMDSAIALGKHLLSIAVDVCAEITKEPEHIRILRVLKLVEATGVTGLTKTQLWKQTGLGRRAFVETLQQLEELDLIHIDTTRAPGQAGRPPVVIRSAAAKKRLEKNSKRLKELRDSGELKTDVIQLYPETTEEKEGQSST